MVFLYLISKGCENMEKSLEQLKQEYEKTTVLLEQEKRKMQRLKNRQRIWKAVPETEDAPADYPWGSY